MLISEEFETYFLEGQLVCWGVDLMNLRTKKTKTLSCWSISIEGL